MIKEIKQIIHKYIWNGKKTKIKYNTIIQNYELGGLKLHEIETKILTLKLNWIKRLYNSRGSWKAYLASISNELKISLQDLLLSKKLITRQSKFYNSIFKDWWKLRTNS